MLGCVDFWYLATLQGKRAASQSLLLGAFYAETGSTADCFSDPVMAYTAAMRKANPGDIIVIYGSFLTVSAVMVADELRLEEF